MQNTATRALPALPDQDGSVRRRVATAGVGVLEVDGEVSGSVAKQLAADLLELARDGVCAVAVDLSGVTASEFSLLAALARAHTALRARGGQLYLIAGGDHTLERLRSSGFDRIVTVVFARSYREQLSPRPGEVLGVRVSRRNRVIDLRDAVQHRHRHARAVLHG